MGLAEQIRAGASLERSTITLITDSQKSGSVNLGIGYALLNIRTNVPCRFRLYDTADSLENVGEASRSFGNLNISSSVALVGDFTMSLAGTPYSVDPILYGLVQNSSTGLSYYRVDNATTPPEIQITRYLIEDSNVPASTNSTYNISNRRSFTIQTSSLAINGAASGTLGNNSAIPQTYLLVSASVSGTNNVVRLRLYSDSSPLLNAGERARNFEQEPTSSISLIVDAFISGSQTTYFVPKIVGANLQNMGTDLIPLRLNRELVAGNNELYYIIENKSNVATQVTASLHVYTFED